jgi:hypothetical protein
MMLPEGSLIVNRRNTLSSGFPVAGSDAVSVTVCLSPAEIGLCSTLRSSVILSEFDDVSVVSIGVSAGGDVVWAPVVELLSFAVGNGNCTLLD